MTKLDELKGKCISSSFCIVCKSKQKLVPIRLISRHVCAISAPIFKQLPLAFYCEKCLRKWKEGIEWKYSNMLSKCTTFQPIPKKESYSFWRTGETLVFLASELTEQQHQLVFDIRYLKRKLTYIKGKGYNIPFDKPLGKKYYVKKGTINQPHLDKYGNKINIKR